MDGQDTCTFCAVVAVDHVDGDTMLEGEEVLGLDSNDSMNLTVWEDKNGTAFSARLIVNETATWEEAIPYRIGDQDGVFRYDNSREGMAQFDVCFCPMCGRRLVQS